MDWRNLLAFCAAALCAGTAAAGPFGYAVQGGGCPDLSCSNFGIEDLATGAFNPIGASFGFVPNNGGLAWANGVLYSYDAVANNVYSVDPTTGAFTNVGTANVGAGNIAVLGASLGVLYELALPTMDLYSFNPNDDSTTLVGPTEIPAPSSDLSNLGVILMAGLGANLYVDYYLLDTEGNPLEPDSLYWINPATGQAALVGGISGAGCLEGLGAVQNTLYGFDACSGPPGVYTINTGNAVATFNSNETVGPILSAVDVPEPGSFATIGLIMVLIGVVKGGVRAGRFQSVS